MATKRTPLPSAGELAHYSGPLHPVVSAMQFAANTRDYGGASMNAHTGQVLEVGKHSGYAVGGAESSWTGGRVQTRSLPIPHDGPASLSISDVLTHRTRIARTGPDDPTRLMGSWDARGSKANPRDEIDIDASNHMQGRRQAKRAGKRRGEDAIFGLNSGRDIRTSF